MNANTNTSMRSASNGESTGQELFALTDEQILDIEPQQEVASDEWRVASENRAAVISSLPAQAGEARNPSSPDAPSETLQSKRASSVASISPKDGSQAESHDTLTTEHGPQNTGHQAQPGMAVPREPPAWLAAQMKDPWSGEEAKELWNGIQQAKQEAAAYRSAFATPEEARALKELYPGGVNEARSAADRARVLDEIDRAYFGAVGNSPQQTAAARTQLAAMMLREDPAAFREMVFAGLRALEAAGKGTGSPAMAVSDKSVAAVFRPRDLSASLAQPGSAPGSPTATAATNGSPPGPSAEHSIVGAQHAAAVPAPASPNEAHVASYAAFEKAANEDLERSVGAAITRTIDQALPNLKGSDERATVGTRQVVHLRDRLGAAIRQDVEASLKGDRQLGEQIAQILSARRFDDETRAQVVRLINDRARHLVPGAARRVINDWTQTTLAAHRNSASRADAASTRRELEPASAPAGPPRSAQTRSGIDPNRGSSRTRAVDYRKLSDEQILDL